MRSVWLSLAFVLGVALPVSGQEAVPKPEGRMTLVRLNEILLVLDADTRRAGPAFELTIEDVPILIITDENADRMRAMVPIRLAEDVEADEWQRLMQANFDSALDARYAVAQGRLWSVFIHPLSPLEKNQLISGIAQTVNAAQTYGSLYTGGAMQFGGGDSNPLQRQLIDRLLEKGQEI